MADSNMTADKIRQLLNSKFPFNPFSREEIGGLNLRRLQQGMEMFNWDDPRFISASEAQANGWTIRQATPSVTIRVRNHGKGNVEDIKLFNARSVPEMPSIAAMLLMKDAELFKLQIGGEQQIEEEEIEVMPAREREIGGIENESSSGLSSITSGELAAGAAPEKIGEHSENASRYCVMAEYWLAGLHNARGIALANEINSEIQRLKLEKDKDAVAKLLGAHPTASRFKLSVVTEEQYLANPHRKTNSAEPATLLGGKFVRDEHGAYRPREGGRAILEDKGESLTLKKRDKDGYAAAMELAIAKGWTAIELKGKPAMLADAWLEAKLKGLDVVNYSPTKEDLTKYSERLAQESAFKSEVVQPRPEIVQPRIMEQLPEHVEVRPYVGEDGLTKTATVTYTVFFEREGQEEQQFTDPKLAAKHFHSLPGSTLPAVVRTVTRADGVVEDGIMVAGTSAGTTKDTWAKSADAKLDSVFNEAFNEVIEEEKLLEENRMTGVYSGMIVSIEKGIAFQKTGRDPKKLVPHDLKKLSRVPAVGVVEEIAYDNEGRGTLKEIGQEREYAGRERSR